MNHLDIDLELLVELAVDSDCDSDLLAEEVQLDRLLQELFYDDKTAEKINKSYEHSDRYRFGLTFSHAINRLTTASLTDHTLANTRKALAKTVEDCDTPDEIAFLRRDMGAGKALMQRITEKHKDPKERAEAKRHLAWLNSEYAKLLADRLKAIKGERV